MPYTSTTNLLTAVNRVLLDVGERSVPSFGSIPAKKAVNCLQQALNLIQSSHKWEWLYDRVPAVAWNLGTATVMCKTVRGVSFLTSTGYRDLQYLDVRDFDTQVSAPFDSLLNLSNRPFYYTQTAFQTYKVNPYPVDTEGQQKVIFYVVLDLAMPVLTTDLFPIPEKFMELVYLKADSLLAIKHLEDMNSAQMYEREYLTLLSQYRNDENKTPTGGFNMYKPRYRRYF